MNYYSSLKVDKTKLPHVYTYIYSHSNAVAVLFKKLSLSLANEIFNVMIAAALLLKVSVHTTTFF